MGQDEKFLRVTGVGFYAGVITLDALVAVR
jgi:hypothetical protein